MRRIALHMLMGDTGKYFGIVAGVMFASLLLVQQLAMFAGIMTQMYSGISAVNADIWVMDPKVRYIDDSQPMTDGQLGRVRSVEGVAWAVQLYKGSVQAKLEDGTNAGVALYGLDDTTFIGGPARMVQGKLSDLRQSEAVVVDLMSAMDKLAHVNRNGNRQSPRRGVPRTEKGLRGTGGRSSGVARHRARRQAGRGNDARGTFGLREDNVDFDHGGCARPERR